MKWRLCSGFTMLMHNKGVKGISMNFPNELLYYCVVLVLCQMIIEGFENIQESEFPPTIDKIFVGAISESRPII